MAAKQIAGYRYEQAKPQDEHEHGEDVGHEIGKCEPPLEQHVGSPNHSG
jgi:hypothetical protein